MKSADGFLNARQAAAYVGYEPQPTLHSREDPQMRCFYAWALDKERRGLLTRHRRDTQGTLLFKRDELDRALGRTTAEYDAQKQDRLARMAELGRQQARGEDGWRCVH